MKAGALQHALGRSGPDLGGPEQPEGRRQPRCGETWAQPGTVKAFHTGSFHFRWRRMQSHCLKMGVGGGFEIQNSRGSGTRELLRGPSGGTGGRESLRIKELEPH